MYEWREHTAEIELVIEADSEDEVFRQALEAFGRLVELDERGEPTTLDISLEAPDRASLLVAWLEELIFLADSRSFVPDRAAKLELSGDALRARVDGRTAAFDPLVKAATYHGLELRRSDGSWRARVVLDV